MRVHMNSWVRMRFDTLKTTSTLILIHEPKKVEILFMKIAKILSGQSSPL